jgi:hypothetical protein
MRAIQTHLEHFGKERLLNVIVFTLAFESDLESENGSRCGPQFIGSTDFISDAWYRCQQM